MSSLYDCKVNAIYELSAHSGTEPLTLIFKVILKKPTTMTVDTVYTNLKAYDTKQWEMTYNPFKGYYSVKEVHKELNPEFWL